MKITHIQASNVMGARAIGISLGKPVALFAGKNGAGKSSLQEAVRMALAGETVRVDLKKDYGALITEGQDSGFVEVATTDAAYSMVLPSGKGIHYDNATLPFVLDAQRFARLDGKERRAFLFGLMGVKMDGASVTQRLKDKGCDTDKVEFIAPFLRAGFDAASKEAAGKAREAKGAWKTITGGETWGKDKAATWQPAALPADSEKAQAKYENARTKAQETDKELGAAQQALGETKAKQKAIDQQAAQRAELEERAGRIDRIKAKLVTDEAELQSCQVRVDEARAKAGVATVNPKAPGEFLLRGLASATRDFLDLSTKYELIDKETDETRPFDADLVLRAATHLSEFNKAHSPQEGVQQDPEAAAKLPELERALTMCQNAVANDKRDLEAAERAAAQIKEMDSQTGEPIDLEALQARVTELETTRDNWRADAEKYRAVAEQAERRQAVIEQATKHHQDVMEWTALADALAPDGIPGEILAEALGPINDRLKSNATCTEWQPVAIHHDMEITYGGRSYALISESEKWRADAMIAEAVSHLSGLKLLVLDRFDVLDLKGREDLLYWLDGMAIDGDIDTALIFGTLKALPPLNFDTIEAHWIENGTAGQIQKAA